MSELNLHIQFDNANEWIVPLKKWMFLTENIIMCSEDPVYVVVLTYYVYVVANVKSGLE